MQAQLAGGLTNPQVVPGSQVGVPRPRQVGVSRMHSIVNALWLY